MPCPAAQSQSYPQPYRAEEEGSHNHVRVALDNLTVFSLPASSSWAEQRAHNKERDNTRCSFVERVANRKKHEMEKRRQSIIRCKR